MTTWGHEGRKEEPGRLEKKEEMEGKEEDEGSDEDTKAGRKGEKKTIWSFIQQGLIS